METMKTVAVILLVAVAAVAVECQEEVHARAMLRLHDVRGSPWGGHFIFQQSNPMAQMTISYTDRRLESSEYIAVIHDRREEEALTKTCTFSDPTGNDQPGTWFFMFQMYRDGDKSSSWTIRQFSPPATLMPTGNNWTSIYGRALSLYNASTFDHVTGIPPSRGVACGFVELLARASLYRSNGPDAIDNLGNLTFTQTLVSEPVRMSGYINHVPMGDYALVVYEKDEFFAYDCDSLRRMVLTSPDSPQLLIERKKLGSRACNAVDRSIRSHATLVPNDPYNIVHHPIGLHMISKNARYSDRPIACGYVF